MHESHRKAAEQHELAARAHRTAAEHNEKGDRTAADWHSERALEYSDLAYKLAQEDHTKSGRIVSLSMSTRYNNGSHYENHQRAAELHDVAAHAHRSAAEAHDKQDHRTGQEHSRQILEHTDRAYQHSAQMQRGNANEHGIAMFGHNEISRLAHELWQARGCPQGSPDEDWFHAAHELRARAERLGE